jgi:hypothetical protein
MDGSCKNRISSRASGRFSVRWYGNGSMRLKNFKCVCAGKAFCFRVKSWSSSALVRLILHDGTPPKKMPPPYTGRSYGEHVGEHIGNLENILRNRWELTGNLKGTVETHWELGKSEKKNPLPLTPPPPKLKRGKKKSKARWTSYWEYFFIYLFCFILISWWCLTSPTFFFFLFVGAMSQFDWPITKKKRKKEVKNKGGSPKIEDSTERWWVPSLWPPLHRWEGEDFEQNIWD